jgi:hypothetical protein
MAKKDDLVPVTSDDVAQAWQDVENAKTATEALRHRFVTGDDSVTQPDIAAQNGVVEWLELVAHRTENQRERYEVAYAVQARKDLKATILAEAPATGGELLRLLDTGFSSLLEFVDRADAHDQQIGQWGIDAAALGVPDRGVVSPAHENMATAGSGDILVDGVRVTLINPKNILRLLFNAVENGVLPQRSEEYVQSARSIVANHGKAAI